MFISKSIEDVAIQLSRWANGKDHSIPQWDKLSEEAKKAYCDQARHIMKFVTPPRFEIIDHRNNRELGRILSTQMDFSWQDEGYTLKIFLNN